MENQIRHGARVGWLINSLAATSWKRGVFEIFAEHVLARLGGRHRHVSRSAWRPFAVDLRGYEQLMTTDRVQ